MTNLDTNPTKKLKVGDKVKYTRNFAFGKTGTEISKVIMINKIQKLYEFRTAQEPNELKILLENGQTLYIELDYGSYYQ